MTLDKKSWGYRRVANFNDYMTMDELLQTLAETISCGGIKKAFNLMLMG